MVGAFVGQSAGRRERHGRESQSLGRRECEVVGGVSTDHEDAAVRQEGRGMDRACLPEGARGTEGPGRGSKISADSSGVEPGP